MLSSPVYSDPITVSEHQVKYKAGWPCRPRPEAGLRTCTGEGASACCSLEPGSPGGCWWVPGLVPPLPSIRADGGTARHPGVVLVVGKVRVLQGTTIICVSGSIYSV